MSRFGLLNTPPFSIHHTHFPFSSFNRGFVVNFLDWTKMKDKSDIYKRFDDCHLEFELTRVSGSTVGLDSATLAKSERADELKDWNSIVVTTNSLHGEWQNKVGSLTGWAPKWYPGAVAGVVLASFVLAFLTASTVCQRIRMFSLFPYHLCNSNIAPYLCTFSLWRGNFTVTSYTK